MHESVSSLNCNNHFHIHINTYIDCFRTNTFFSFQVFDNLKSLFNYSVYFASTGNLLF